MFFFSHVAKVRPRVDAVCQLAAICVKNSSMYSKGGLCRTFGAFIVAYLRHAFLSLRFASQPFQRLVHEGVPRNCACL